MTFFKNSQYSYKERYIGFKMTLDQIRDIVSKCSFKTPTEDWLIQVCMDGNRPYLQIRVPNGRDSVTGDTIEWTGRKWMLSPHMVPNEIVTTAFKAVMTAMEHEVRENFKYRDTAIFNPHMDPDQLVEFVRNTNNLQERPDVAFAA